MATDAERAQNSWPLNLYPAVRGRPGTRQGRVINKSINTQIQKKITIENKTGAKKDQSSRCWQAFSFLTAAE